MSVDSWDPNAQAVVLDSAILARLIAYSANAQLDTLSNELLTAPGQDLSSLMKIDHRSWRDAVENFTDDEILHLIRFLAVAENLSGWEALEKSPVIPLAKTLRKRGVRLDKEFLRWLRDNSSNRYLPYGPL